MRFSFKMSSLVEGVCVKRPLTCKGDPDLVNLEENFKKLEQCYFNIKILIDYILKIYELCVKLECNYSVPNDDLLSLKNILEDKMMDDVERLHVFNMSSHYNSVLMKLFSLKGNKCGIIKAIRLQQKMLSIYNSIITTL